MVCCCRIAFGVDRDSSRHGMFFSCALLLVLLLRLRVRMNVQVVCHMLQTTVSILLVQQRVVPVQESLLCP